MSTLKTFLIFHDGGFYLRIRGYGMSVVKANGYKPLFSERMGLRKAHYIFGYRIEFLNRERSK